MFAKIREYLADIPFLKPDSQMTSMLCFEGVNTYYHCDTDRGHSFKKLMMQIRQLERPITMVTEALTVYGRRCGGDMYSSQANSFVGTMSSVCRAVPEDIICCIRTTCEAINKLKTPFIRLLSHLTATMRWCWHFRRHPPL